MLPKKTLIVLPLAILAILLLPSLLALIQPTQTVQEGAKTDGIQNMFKLPLQPIVAEAAFLTNAKPTLVSWYTITAKPTTDTVKRIIDAWASSDKHVKTVIYLAYNESIIWARISLFTAQPLPGGGGVDDLINVYVIYRYDDGMIIAYTEDLRDNDLGKLVTIEGIVQNTKMPIIWLTTDYVIKQIVQGWGGDTSLLYLKIKRGSPKYPTAKWIVVLYSDCAGGINAYYRIYDATKIVKMGYAAAIKVCATCDYASFSGYIQVDGGKVVEARGHSDRSYKCASAYSSGSLGIGFYTATQHNIKVEVLKGRCWDFGYDSFIALIFFIKG